MRSVLIRLLMILGMLIGAGQGWAITVYQKGDLENADVTYYVYDGILHLNGEITHPGQTRNAAFWFIGPKDKVEECDNKTDVGALLYSNGRLRSFLNAPSIAKDEETDKALDDLYGICGGPMAGDHPNGSEFSWLEWGWTSYWLNNPFYDLKVGPEDTGITVSQDMLNDFPGAPRDTAWMKGKEYLIRFWGSKASGAGDVRDHADRTIVYKGAYSIKDETPENQANNKGYFDFVYAPGEPTDYSLAYCQSWVGLKGGVLASRVPGQITGYDRYHVTVGMNPDEYKVGNRYQITTICGIKNKLSNVLNGADALSEEDIVRKENTLIIIEKKPTLTSRHEFEVGWNGPVSVHVPVIMDLYGEFLVGGKKGNVRVTGQLDQDAPDNTTLSYAITKTFDENPNIFKSANEKWITQDCSKCFSFEVPASQLPQEKDAITFIKVMADDPHGVGTPIRPLGFNDLNAFITPYFLDKNDYPVSCSATPASLDHTQIKLKLVVNHPIDMLKATLHLPDDDGEVIYQGNATVTYAESESSTRQTVANIIFDPDGKNTSMVSFANSKDQPWKEGLYYLSIPVKSSGNVGSEVQGPFGSIIKVPVGMINLELDASDSKVLGHINPWSSKSQNMSCSTVWK